MAKAGEKSGRATSLENELSCPVCLDLYKDPVMLSCGHNFCKQCIHKVLDSQQQFPASCPMCKIQLGPDFELQKNFQLCSIVETFLATNSKGQQEDGSEDAKAVVLCDFCLESQPAVKTCLMCDASLCQAHLSKHSATASQQDHVLVEVGTGSVAQERKCQEHGKLLECYCRDEKLYICLLCCIAGQHKGHDIITLKEAYDEQLGELLDMVTWLQGRENALDTALEGLQKSEQQLKTDTKTVSSQMEKLFEQLKTWINQEKMRILCDIESSEKEELTRISEVKEEMKKRRGEAVEHLQSLQKMREQPDVFRFLKEFKLIKDRIYSQDFSIRTTDVAAVQMDEAWIACYEYSRGNFMEEVDALLNLVKREIACRIAEYSEDSNAGKCSETNQVLRKNTK